MSLPLCFNTIPTFTFCEKKNVITIRKSIIVYLFQSSHWEALIETPWISQILLEYKSVTLYMLYICIFLEHQGTSCNAVKLLVTNLFDGLRNITPCIQYVIHLLHLSSFILEYIFRTLCFSSKVSILFWLQSESILCDDAVKDVIVLVVVV